MNKAKGFLTEFKHFAIKGNMIDLAVGVIIGAAFGKIIDSLVADVFMPIITFIMGGEADYSNAFIILSKPDGYTGPHTYEALKEAGANLFAYGNFLTILLNFLLLAFIVFLMVKLIAKARTTFEHQQAQDEAVAKAEAPTPEDLLVLQEIRDLLKAQSINQSKQSNTTSNEE